MSQKYKILLLPGDGIGSEVIYPTSQIISKTLEILGKKADFWEANIGHAGILNEGNPLPENTLNKAKQADAILFGAVGDPMYDNNPNLKIRPEQGLLKIRQELNLFANLRPIKIFPSLIESSPIKLDRIKGTDILFFRELTGGIYFGKPRERRENGEIAVDTCVYSKTEVRRIAELAFEASMKRRKKVTSVDKSNVLETSRLWKETVNDVALNYPEVELEHQLVDSMAMKLISKPSEYDVILTSNLFGDILTDEASQITGSLGMLASASIGTEFGLFEPIHGSAPDIAGQNLANPLAAILSASMLLEIGLGLPEGGRIIDKAVEKTLNLGYRTGDIANPETPKNQILGTKEMAQMVLNNIHNL